MRRLSYLLLLLGVSCTAYAEPYLFYFKDDPKAVGGEEFILNALGFNSGAAFYRKRMCIAKVGDETDIPVCSSPLAGIRNGGITYDEDSQRVFVVTEGSEETLDIPDPQNIPLDKFYKLEKNVNISSFPLGPNAIQKRVSEIQKIYTQDHMLFETCLESASRLTGLSPAVIKKVFQLNESNSTPATFYFKTHENFCQLLALKGDAFPLAASNESSTDLMDGFFSRASTYRVKTAELTRDESEYKNQLITIALFHFLLRVQDIDRAIVNQISQLEADERQASGFDACALADRHRLIKANVPKAKNEIIYHNFNLNMALYNYLWTGEWAGKHGTSRTSQIWGDKHPKVGIVFSKFLEKLHISLTQYKPDHFIDLEKALKETLFQAGQWVDEGLAERGVIAEKKKNFTIEKLLCELSGRGELTPECDVDSTESISNILSMFSDISTRVIERPSPIVMGKFNAWFSGSPVEVQFQQMNQVEQHAFYIGLVGFAKAIEHFKDFIGILNALKHNVRLVPDLFKTFLTGHLNKEGSFINKNTFLSYQLESRSKAKEAASEDGGSDSDNLIFLNPNARVVSLKIQNIQFMGVHERERSPIRCQNLDHSGLQNYVYYLDAASEIYGHEKLRSQLDKILPQGSAEGTTESTIGQLREILRERPGFLAYFMTENISGLIAQYKRYLKTVIRNELKRPAIDSLVFDAVPMVVGRTRGGQDVKIPGFGLVGSFDSLKGEVVPRSVFDMVQRARFTIDGNFFAYTSHLQGELSHGADQSMRKVDFLDFIKKYLSDTAVKKLLFGCVTQKSLLKNVTSAEGQTFENLSLTCPADLQAEGTEVVGYADYESFKNNINAVHTFKFDSEFIHKIAEEKERFNKLESKKNRPPDIFSNLSYLNEAISISEAFKILMELMDYFKAEENTLARESIYADQLKVRVMTGLLPGLSLFKFDDVYSYMRQVENGEGVLDNKLSLIMAHFGSGLEEITSEIKRMAKQRYIAMANLQTGLSLRLALMGWVMRELPLMSQWTLKEIKEKKKDRGIRLAKALDVFNVDMVGETAVQKRRKDITELTEEEKRSLKIGRLLIFRDPGGRYIPITREAYRGAEAKAAQVYLKDVSGSDLLVSAQVADQNDLKKGAFKLKVLTHEHDNKAGGRTTLKQTLITSQEGHTQLYSNPKVLQIRELKNKTDALIIQSNDDSDDVVGAGEKVFRQQIIDALNPIPEPPTKENPVMAMAQKFDLTKGDDGVGSIVGFPGRTSKIYQEPMDETVMASMTQYLSESPRFSMHFEGAFIDTFVFKDVQNPLKLKKWTEFIQKWIRKFISENPSLLKKETWVSESFSSGLTHKAQFKTHALTLPLKPLLKGAFKASVAETSAGKLQRDIGELKRSVEYLQERLAATDQKNDGELYILRQEVQRKTDAYQELFAQVDELSERDLFAFQVLDRMEQDENRYFSTHRYFKEHTAQPFLDKEDQGHTDADVENLKHQVIHVVMHEFKIWKIAQLTPASGDGQNEAFRGSTVKLLEGYPILKVHHQDLPLIRSHLKGQYQFHPGAMHHVWDEWDASHQAQRDSIAQGSCNATNMSCQNVYFYYGGSHLMAFNLRDGVWFRSEGWNRLGIDIADLNSKDPQNLQRNDMASSLTERIRGGSIKDHTAMPYRLWWTIPNSPPFFNPLAGEWTFQNVFLTLNGVGRTKQWMVGLRGLGKILGDGITPKSMVHVVEALAQPGGEFHLHLQPKYKKAQAEAKDKGMYQHFRAVFWKHFNDIQLHTKPGQKEFMLTHLLKIRPFKQWQFYNYYENAYPNHESYLNTYFSFDRTRSGDSGYLHFNEMHYDFERAEQFDKKAWYKFWGDSVYFNTTPVCIHAAYRVQADAGAEKAYLLNNKIRTQGGPIEQYIMPEVRTYDDERFEPEFDNAFTAVDHRIGPTMLSVVPYTSGENKSGWLFSTMSGTYDPTISGRGIIQVRNQLTDSFGKDYELKEPEFNSTDSPITPEALGRIDKSKGINTWIPGMCMPFHTQGAITGMTIVHEK
jgi:transposase-like protein